MNNNAMRALLQRLLAFGMLCLGTVVGDKVTARRHSRGLKAT